MRSSILISGLVALAAANTDYPEPTLILPPPAYPPTAPSSLLSPGDITRASSSTKCTLTTTLTLTLTRTIPVVLGTPSHTTASETGISEPSSCSFVPPPPPPPSVPYSGAPSSSNSEESLAPMPIHTATIPTQADETSAASTALAESSLSAASQSSVVTSEKNNVPASYIPVPSASSKPVGGVTTVLTSMVSGTGIGTGTGTGTGMGSGTGSYRPSSTPLFTDAADAVRVPGVVVGVVGWAVLML